MLVSPAALDTGYYFSVIVSVIVYLKGTADLSCVAVASIEGDIVPKEGDEVTYKRCLMPPKNEKFAAVHVHIAHQAPVAHEKWDKDAIERPVCSPHE